MATQINFSKINLQDALDLAILVEEEAKERYEEFARQIGSSYTGDAGTFFTFMAENEAKHGQELAAQRKKLFGDKPSSITHDMISEVNDVEAPEYDKARPFMSPMHALQVALACEVKAYHFFNQAINHVTDPDVKKLFSELKDEEIHHQNLIKDLMKKTPGDASPEVDPDDVDGPQGL